MYILIMYYSIAVTVLLSNDINFNTQDRFQNLTSKSVLFNELSAVIIFIKLSVNTEKTTKDYNVNNWKCNIQWSTLTKLKTFMYSVCSISIGILICPHALIYKTFHSLKSLSYNSGLCVLITIFIHVNGTYNQWYI